MTREEFQEIHGFDEVDMARIADLRRVLEVVRPSVVMDASKGRWVPVNGGKNGI